MSLLACKKEGTVSILQAHVGVCGVVCVNIHARMFVCQMCMVYGCVYMCISVCHCVSTFIMVDTSLQVYLHVSVITQIQNNTQSFGSCSLLLNPRCACAVRVTVLRLVCLCVCLLQLAWLTWRLNL